MSETIYGNQVIYITCKSSQINSIPIKDGQLIVLMDSDGMFYDMGSVRHQLNGFKIVNELPDKGIDNCIYAVLSDSTIHDLYVYYQKKFVKILPSFPIDSDAPEDGHWYMRVNKGWKSSPITFYIDEEDSGKDAIDKLNTFLSQDIVKGKEVSIIGTMKFDGLTAAPSINGNYASLDFTNTNFRTFCNGAKTSLTVDDTSSQWYYIRIYRAIGVIGLDCVRTLIEMSDTYCPISTDRLGASELNLVSRCNLIDSKIYAGVNTEISNCNILATNIKYVAVTNEASMTILNNKFMYPLNDSVQPWCAIIDTKANMVCKDNEFYKGYALQNSSTNTGSYFKGIAIDVLSSSDYNNKEVCTKFEFPNIRENNSVTITSVSIDFLRWSVLNPTNSNLYHVGDILHIDYSSVPHRILEVNSRLCNELNLIFEISPESKMSKLSLKNIASYWSSRAIDIVQKDYYGNEVTTKVTPMSLSQRFDAEILNRQPILADNEFNPNMLAFYKDKSKLEELNVLRNSNRALYATYSQLQKLSSGMAEITSSGLEYYYISADGSIGKTTQDTTQDDIRVIVAI